MNRVAVCAVAGICVALSGCASSGLRPAFVNLPADCRPIETKTVTLSVDEMAQVSSECIAIHKGYTDITWQGGQNVKYLLIAFKDDNNLPPLDPPFGRGKAKFAKSDSRTKEGDFRYSVIVVRKDGSVKSVDPRLIIQR